MSVPPVRVIKVGGSLFDLPDLRTRIADWLAANSGFRNLFVAGGGKPCDFIRDLDTQFGFTESASHEICVELLGPMAMALGEILDLPLAEVSNSDAFHSDLVFDVRKWCRGKNDLPRNWSVSSDSIAAILARQLEAPLVLFKSTDLDEHLMDDYFPTARQELRSVEVVNLRSDRWA